MSIRERLAALAVSFEGVSVSSERERYLELVAPADVEPAATRNGFAHPKVSGCALVVRGLWRLAGLDHAVLVAPYRIGHAIVDVVTMAREARAWSVGTARLPELGDVVLVGTGGREHVYTVVRCSDGEAFESIDGGQLDGSGQQCIKRRRRTWVDGDDVTTDEGRSIRPVVGVVDVAKLFG